MAKDASEARGIVLGGTAFIPLWALRRARGLDSYEEEDRRFEQFATNAEAYEIMSAGGLIGRAERPRWVWPLLGLATLLCAGTVASLAAAMDGADWGWLTVVVAAFMGLLLGLGVGIWFQDHRWQALGRRLGEHAED